MLNAREETALTQRLMVALEVAASQLVQVVARRIGVVHVLKRFIDDAVRVTLLCAWTAPLALSSASETVDRAIRFIDFSAQTLSLSLRS